MISGTQNIAERWAVSKKRPSHTDAYCQKTAPRNEKNFLSAIEKLWKAFHNFSIAIKALLRSHLLSGRWDTCIHNVARLPRQWIEPLPQLNNLEGLYELPQAV
jgi:hypothetical protein